MHRVVEVRHPLVAAVDGQRVHGQVVGADGEEIADLGERVGGERRARHLDHHAERRQGHGDIGTASMQAAGGAAEDFPRRPNLGNAGDEGQQDAHRPDHAGPQDGAELRFQEIRPGQRPADAAHAERRGGAQPEFPGERIDADLAAEVRRADGDRLPLRALDDVAENLELLVLPRWRAAVDEQELAAQEADAGSAHLGHHVHLDGQLDVRLQGDLDAIAGHRPALGQPAEAPPFALAFAAAMAERGGAFRRRIDDDAAALAIDQDPLARLHGARDVGNAQHRRHPEGAGHDRGVALPPARRCGDPDDPVGVQLRGIRRRQFVGDDDRAAGQALQRLAQLAGQVADQPAADLADVFDARRQVGVLHRFEAAADRRDLGLDGRLGIDPVAGDPLGGAAQQPRILEHVKVGVEEIADLLGGDARTFVGPLADALAKPRDLAAGAHRRVLQALLLAFDLGGRDAVFRHVGNAAFPHVGDADADPRRHAEAVENTLSGRLGHRFSQLLRYVSGRIGPTAVFAAFLRRVVPESGANRPPPRTCR